MAQQDFIGAGWNYPLQVDATGGIALAVGSREIEQAIEIILRTSPGERPMRPEFGCRVQDHIFAPADAATAAAIAYDVRDALEQWEPRIDVEDVTAEFPGNSGVSGDGLCIIDVSYRIRGRSDIRNLVFPFYVIGQENEEVTLRKPPAQPS